MLYPFVWMISSSLKPNTEIYGRTSLIPSKVMWNNYRDGWFSIKPHSYARFYGNTAVLVLAAPSAPSCHRARRLRLRPHPFSCTKRPLHAAAVDDDAPRSGHPDPDVHGLGQDRFLGTYVPLIFPAFTAPAFYTFLVRQFMMGIRRSSTSRRSSTAPGTCASTRASLCRCVVPCSS